MSQAIKTLDDIGEWGSGGTPKSTNPRYYDGLIPWLVIEDLNDGIVSSSTKTITKEGLENSSAKLVEPNTLLIAMYGSIGKLGIAGFHCATNQAIAFCKPNPKKVDLYYLFYYLLSQRKNLNMIGKGVTQQNISQTILKNYPIPLPPLEEQRRIAAILAEADHARLTRRFTQSLSDGFLQEVFVEMFGDIESHNQLEELDTLADVVSGVTKGQKYKDTKTYEVPYLRVANVQDGYLDLSEIKTISASAKEIEKYTLKEGDIVMTEGGDFDKLGRGAVWRNEVPHCVHQNHVFRVRLNREKVLPIFFAAYIQSQEVKLYFLNASKQTTNLASINMTQLKALPVPLVPLSKQWDFVEVIEEFQYTKEQQHESERQTEYLFQTLLHRAFHGGL